MCINFYGWWSGVITVRESQSGISVNWILNWAKKFLKTSIKCLKEQNINRKQSLYAYFMVNIWLKVQIKAIIIMISCPKMHECSIRKFWLSWTLSPVEDRVGWNVPLPSVYHSSLATDHTFVAVYFLSLFSPWYLPLTPTSHLPKFS